MNLVIFILDLWGGAHPKKNQKKPKKTKPIYQFWCSDWFFLVFFGFFWVFLVFFGFFWFFLVFFWDDIPTLKSNAKKTKTSQKKPKKTKKTPKNPKKPKNQFPISNVGQSLSQKKPKKNQKKPKKTSFQFRILAKTNAKKNKKKTKKNQKKTNANLEILKNQKKPKKTKKNQCQFADFGVATGFFWLFWVSTPPIYLWV